MNPERITYFAETDARSKRVPFGIKAKDRTRHVYVIGKTGMGKSTLLENMAVQDIKNGEGMAFIDPHGKTAELLLEYIPPERMKDVLYFAPFDTDFPISFNVLESVDPDKRHLVVSGLMSTFKKIWQDAWSARMEYILTNTLLALLEYPGATLLGVNRMLAEKDFRKDVIDHVTDISVKNFWVKEFANYTERMAAEAVPAIQNKIGQFTANALIRNMIGQPKSSFNIRDMMDNKKILIINLSKGKIGESNANLLGGMLITKIYLAAMSRADLSNRVMATMPNFYLFVDEFQSFANESFADILSEARKYHLNLTIAHQYIEQMEEEVRAAVFGNVGTMIIFRVGAYDAEVLEKEFAPTFTAEDIVNLGQYQIYLKLMIDGISSQPFSATNLPPIKPPEVDHAAEVLAASREQFAHKRGEVEATINDWHKPVVRTPTQSAMSSAQQQSPSPRPIATASPAPAPRPVQSPPSSATVSARTVAAPSPVASSAPASPTPTPSPVLTQYQPQQSQPQLQPQSRFQPQSQQHQASQQQIPRQQSTSRPVHQRTAPVAGSIAAAITAALATSAPVVSQKEKVEEKPKETLEKKEQKTEAPVPRREPHEPHLRTQSQTYIHPTVQIPAHPHSPHHPQSMQQKQEVKSVPTQNPIPKPAFQQPFKDALKTVEVVQAGQPTASPQSGVPLVSLKKVPGKNDQKTPTQKNINDLKSILAAVTGSLPKKAEDKAEIKTAEKVEEKPQEKLEQKTEHKQEHDGHAHTHAENHKEHPKKEHAAQDQNDRPDMTIPKREVPKDVLEKILK